MAVCVCVCVCVCAYHITVALAVDECVVSIVGRVTVCCHDSEIHRSPKGREIRTFFAYFSDFVSTLAVNGSYNI
jgi:hypothetical protein